MSIVGVIGVLLYCEKKRTGKEIWIGMEMFTMSQVKLAGTGKKHYTRIAMGRLPPIVIEGVEHIDQTAVYEDV